MTKTEIAQSLLKSGENLATQRVMGYSRTVTRTKGKKNPKVITENLNVGIQAWEIGILVAAAGAYYYLTGNHIQDAIVSGMNVVNPGNPLNRLGAITTTPLTVGMLP